MDEKFAKPNPLIFEGSVTENWRRFKQKFVIYNVASGIDKKTKGKICILLNLAGEQAIETYNTFTYGKGESKEDLDVEIKSSKSIVIRKKT